MSGCQNLGSGGCFSFRQRVFLFLPDHWCVGDGCAHRLTQASESLKLKFSASWFLIEEMKDEGSSKNLQFWWFLEVFWKSVCAGVSPTLPRPGPIPSS